jgi:O-antigen/teichoic acid export membrane protein
MPGDANEAMTTATRQACGTTDPPIFGRPHIKPAVLPASGASFGSARRWRALGKEASWVLIGQAAAGAGSLVGVRILTGILSPAVFGELALGLTVVMILQYCYAGTSAAAMRFFVPALEKGQFAEYLRAAWRMQHFRSVLLVPLIGLATLILATTAKGSHFSLALAALALAVVTSYGTFIDALQNAGRQRAIVALHQGLGSWLRLGSAVLLFVLVDASAASVLWGFAWGAVLTVGSQYVFYRRIKQTILPVAAGNGAIEPPRQWQAMMAGFASPYVVWSVPAWLQFASDRWALDWFGSPVEVGVYAAFCQLAFLPINTFSQLVTQTAMPILFARAGDLTSPSRVTSSRSLNGKLIVLLGSWMLLCTAAALMLQVPIGHLLLDARYHGSLHLLPLFVLSAGLFVTAQLLELNIITANQTTRLIWPKSVVSILACAAYCLGACSYGMVGVIWAGIIARIGFLVWILRIDQGLVPQKENALS